MLPPHLQDNLLLLNKAIAHASLSLFGPIELSSCVSCHPQFIPHFLGMLCGAIVPLLRWFSLSGVSVSSLLAEPTLWVYSSLLCFPGLFLKVMSSLRSLSLSPRNTCLLYFGNSEIHLNQPLSHLTVL